MSQVSFDPKSVLIKEFDRNGLILRPSTLERLLKRAVPLSSSFEIFRNDNTAIINQVKTLFMRNPSLDSNVLDDNVLEEALKMLEISRRTNETGNNSTMAELLKKREETSLIVLNAFTDFPQVNDNKGVLGNAEDKISAQIKRFLRIKEKLSRNPRFSIENMKGSRLPKSHSSVYEIVEIGTLVGTQGEKMIFGVFVELDLGNFFLQDLYSKVRLDLSKCQPCKGYVCLGNAYVVVGEYSGEAFKVKSFMLPFFETRRENVESRDIFGADTKFMKFYGEVMEIEIKNQGFVENSSGKDMKSKKTIEKLIEKNLSQQVFLGCFDLKRLREVEDDKSFKNSSVVIFSSFLLTSESLSKFETILKAFEETQPPLVFVLMGEFSPMSELRDSKDSKEYHQNLDLFLKIVQKFPKVTQFAAWLFIPSTTDLGLSILPREGLPNFVYEKIRKVLPLSFNCSNPCRAKILGKEFEFIRNDIAKELRRNAVVPTDTGIEIEEAFVDTVLSQYYLNPINPYFQPVYWKYDSCLAIEKLPNFLVIGEGFCRPFERKIVEEEDDGTFVVSPGNWGKHAGFVAVYPFLNIVQICKAN